MNGRWLAVLGLLVIVGALLTQSPLLLRVGYVLVALVLVAAVITWTAIRWVEVGRNTRARRAEVDGLCEESFTIVNRGWLPKPWLEIRDHSDLPGHRAGRAITTLGPGRTRTWTVRTRCLDRGLFTLGPLTIAAGDPLGMFRIEREISPTARFLVYPRTVPLPGFDLSSGFLPGGPTTRRQARLASSDVRGVRPYLPGDPFNRVHWRTTARRGRLFTKEFEVDPIADLWLVPDLHHEAQAGLPAPVIEERIHLPWEPFEPRPLAPNTEEYAVTLAASLARRFLDAGKSVGLVAYGTRHVVLQPDRGERQLGRILANLAVLRAAGEVGLAEVIAAEGHQFVGHMSLVCITAAAGTDWIDALRELRFRGIFGLAVVLDSTSFGAERSNQSVPAALAARGIAHRVVRNGDDLDRALRG